YVEPGLKRFGALVLALAEQVRDLRAARPGDRSLQLNDQRLGMFPQFLHALLGVPEGLRAVAALGAKPIRVGLDRFFAPRGPFRLPIGVRLASAALLLEAVAFLH